MRNTSHLAKAKANRKDEFYTDAYVVEEELALHDFKGKWVYCNCDDPGQSEFVRYFRDNFKRLGLKRFTATFYVPKSVWKKDPSRKPYRYDFYGLTAKKSPLRECSDMGSFDSEECREILSQCDCVVTNPPFSLLRNYLSLVIDSGKEYLVLGHQANLTSPKILEEAKAGRMHYGGSIHGGDRYFRVPDTYKAEPQADTYVDNQGHRHIAVTGVRWFTNMGKDPNLVPVEPVREYSEGDYRKVDGTDILYIDRTKDIPRDYKGEMAVPVSYYDHHDPKRFRILGSMIPSVDGEEKFRHLLIKPVSSRSRKHRAKQGTLSVIRSILAPRRNRR